eukprot:4580664-Pyramimonas_sp.AAC.1
MHDVEDDVGEAHEGQYAFNQLMASHIIAATVGEAPSAGAAAAFLKSLSPKALDSMAKALCAKVVSFLRVKDRM